MAYVVLQKGMEAPPMEQLKAAFRCVPGLTPADAAMMCKNSLGILLRGVDQNEAQQIQASLAAQGVETEVVEQSALPVLPPMRHVTQVECTPEALMIHDPVGRSFPLAWRDIMMVAAGSVGVIDFKRTSTPSVLPMDQGSLGTIDELLFKNTGLPQLNIPHTAYADPHYETREVHHQRWTAEVVIRGGGLRYNLEADQALQPLFLYLKERRTDDMTQNFQLLVQDICQFAPGAAVNRGAYYLREGNAAAFAYPTKNAFYDEMVWLLWQLAGEGSKI
jgi:hypothetical protein